MAKDLWNSIKIEQMRFFCALDNGALSETVPGFQYFFFYLSLDSRLDTKLIVWCVLKVQFMKIQLQKKHSKSLLRFFKFYRRLCIKFSKIRKKYNLKTMKNRRTYIGVNRVPTYPKWCSVSGFPLDNIFGTPCIMYFKFIHTHKKHRQFCYYQVVGKVGT